MVVVVDGKEGVIDMVGQLAAEEDGGKSGERGANEERKATERVRARRRSDGVGVNEKRPRGGGVRTHPDAYGSVMACMTRVRGRYLF